MRIPVVIWIVLGLGAVVEVGRAVWGQGTLEFLPWIAAAAGLLGLNLAWRSLFHDPWPGRDLCPRCRYETAAIRGLTCPECGFKASARPVWRKRPKRWGLALLGLALVAAFPAALFAKRAAGDGFWPAWPTMAIVWLSPMLPADAWDELESRLIDNPDMLSDWQRRAMASRCERTAVSQRALTIRLAALDLLLWHEPESVQALRAFRVVSRDPDAFVADWAVSNCRSSWLPRELAVLIDDTTLGAERRAELIWSARFRRLECPELTDALGRALGDSDEMVSEAAAEALSAQRDSARRRESGGGLGWNWAISTGEVVAP